MNLTIWHKTLGNKYIELPIIEHVTIHNTFQYFSHSLPKLSNFWIIGHASWRATNILLSVRRKGAIQKTEEVSEW